MRRVSCRRSRAISRTRFGCSLRSDPFVCRTCGLIAGLQKLKGVTVSFTDAALVVRRRSKKSLNDLEFRRTKTLMPVQCDRRTFIGLMTAMGLSACASIKSSPKLAADLRWADATATAGLIASRQISVREAVEAAIARIERLNPTYNFLVAADFDHARMTAAAPAQGPFSGG